LSQPFPRALTRTRPGLRDSARKRCGQRTMLSPKGGNLFADTQVSGRGERFDIVLQQRNLVIERIVSGASDLPSPEYRQAQDEWVVLLQGQAVLMLDGESIALAPGEYVFIPAGLPHTVMSRTEGALWLAVHLMPE
jgi:cupin 2 domain-containing protein